MSTGAPPGPAQPPPPVVHRKGDRGKIYTVIGVVVVAAIVVGVGAGTSWYGLRPSASSSTSPGACPTGTTLQGQGASFVNAVMSQWTSNFASATGNHVDYTPNSAGQGISALAERLVDFAMTDEPLNVSEVASMPGPLLTLPVTGGPVTIVYNIQGYTGPLNLTPQELAGIYLGTISVWNSSLLTWNNPGLPDHPIVTVHRSDAAGTTYVLTNLLSIYNQTWNTTVGTTIQPTPWPSTPQSNAVKGNSALATYVQKHTNTIGYVDLPDAVNDALSTAKIYNKAGEYVGPTLASTTAAIANLSGQKLPPATGNWSAVSWVNAPGANSYALATLSYILVLHNLALGVTASLSDAEVVVQWLHFVLTTGQTESSSADFVNPPANLVTQDLNALALLNFSDAAIPACT